MKDYYKILGVKKNATFYDIAEAYKERSLQYHPDNEGPGDEEDAETYEDIQEAYNTLSNGIKRREYDNYVIHVQNSLKEKTIKAIPTIEYFKTDNTEFEYGDDVTFSWKTINADKITLVPFGSVQAEGTYTSKIKNFKNKLLTFELIAENTLNGRESKASVSIKNKNFDEIFQHFKKEIEGQFQASGSLKKAEEGSLQPQKVPQPIRPKPIEHREEVKKQIQYPIPTEYKKKKEVKRSEKSENNILLIVVITFIVIGISILIYLGFFMS